MFKNRLKKLRRAARQRALVASLLIGRRERIHAAGKALLAVSLTCLALFVFAGAHSAAEAAALSIGGGGALGLPMMMGILMPRPQLIKLLPDQGYNGEASVAVFTLPRNQLYRGVVIEGAYTDTLSVAATSIKTYGVPIDRIDVTGGDGNVIHSVRPADIIREQQQECGTPLGSMVVPPTVTTATANAGSFQIPLKFELDDVQDGDQFMLPGWDFGNNAQVKILVYFTNTHANVYTGGTGVVTFAANALVMTYRAVVELPPSYTPARISAESELLFRSYMEQTQAAAANAEWTFDLPRSADIERLYISQQDANGDPVATIVDTVTLKENDQTRRLDAVPFKTLRTIGSERQNTTLPTGWACIDFTQPTNTYKAALPVTGMSSCKVIVSSLAVAGTVRVYMVRKAVK